MERIHVFVSGRVQMVMYRDFTQRTARRLGIVGWVKNLPDGRVEAVAEGTRENLDTFLDALKKGSLLARVDSIEVIREVPTGDLTRFTIRYE